MKLPAFVPGFRFSVRDGLVLFGGVAGAILLSMVLWWQGFIVGFVVAHFFLFCNVVRMARPLELLWSGVFVALASATITIDVPGWVATFVISAVVTVIVVVVEIRKPSYHGVGWKWINPSLPSRWEDQMPKQAHG